MVDVNAAVGMSEHRVSHCVVCTHAQVVSVSKGRARRRIWCCEEFLTWLGICMVHILLLVTVTLIRTGMGAYFNKCNRIAIREKEVSSCAYLPELRSLFRDSSRSITNHEQFSTRNVNMKISREFPYCHQHDVHIQLASGWVCVAPGACTIEVKPTPRTDFTWVAYVVVIIVSKHIYCYVNYPYRWWRS